MKKSTQPFQPPSTISTISTSSTNLPRSRGLALFIVFEHWTTGIKIEIKTRKNVTCLKGSILKMPRANGETFRQAEDYSKYSLTFRKSGRIADLSRSEYNFFILGKDFSWYSRKVLRLDLAENISGSLLTRSISWHRSRKSF